MPEPTDTEIIAKLLGWEKAERKGHYRKWPHYAIAHDIPGLRSSVFRSDGNRIEESFPDLTNWNDIRRMEDALAEKGLRPVYALALSQIPEIREAELSDCEKIADADINEDTHLVTVSVCVGLIPNQAQRVTACVKVLREVQPTAPEGKTP